eukprot:1828813-Amphidinium_carterae.1
MVAMVVRDSEKGWAISLTVLNKAERLEIEVGDRLVAVHGNELPPPDESEVCKHSMRTQAK